MSSDTASATASSSRAGPRRARRACDEIELEPVHASLPGERELAVAHRLGAERLVQSGSKPPCAQTMTRVHGSDKAEEGAFALEDLGQRRAPACVGAAAADRRPTRRAGCSASVRRPGSSITSQHEPLPTALRMPLLRLKAATRKGCTETSRTFAATSLAASSARSSRSTRAGEARSDRRGLGELHLPVGGRRAVHARRSRCRASASHCSALLSAAFQGNSA